MLIAIVDKAGRGGTRKVEEAFEAVERRYAEEGLRLRSPVSAEIVSMPIMGASKSVRDRHTLFVSVRAVQSGTLDGLVAHEMGHMLRTEAHHASHDPDVYRKMGRELRIPRAAEGAFSGAFNHIQDIYADDLAFLVFASDGGDRAYRFFAGWIDGNAEMRGQDRWQNVGLAVTNGFALGNLVRHRLIRPAGGPGAGVRPRGRIHGRRFVCGVLREPPERSVRRDLPPPGADARRPDDKGRRNVGPATFNTRANLTLHLSR